MKRKRTSDRNTAEQVRQVLISKGLTVGEISRRSRALFGRYSPYFVPHNFLASLQRSGFTPSIFELFSLSQISGFRLVDWLGLFGVAVSDIARLQATLSAPRTILLDQSVGESFPAACTLADRGERIPGSRIVPFAEYLRLTSNTAHAAIGSSNAFLYAKIGWEDATAFPDLLPQSIVRIDPSRKDQLPTLNGDRPFAEPIYLIEHAAGYCCSPIRVIDHDRIVLTSQYGTYSHVELRLAHTGKIIGVVDREIRPLRMSQKLRLPYRPSTIEDPDSLLPQRTLSGLLRDTRQRRGLTLRAASAMTRKVAESLGDPQYFLSPSFLSDLEAREQPPRHVHKLIALCIVYALDLATVLRIIGAAPERCGSEPMLLPLSTTAEGPAPSDEGALLQTNEQHGLLHELRREWGEIPSFVVDAIGPLVQLKSPSLRDFFWIPPQERTNHMYLVNACVIGVDRRRKRPRYSPGLPPWLQPVYLVVGREGNYLCGCCNLEGDTLTMVYPYTQQPHRPERLRLGSEVEIVGEVNMIARRLS